MTVTSGFFNSDGGDRTYDAIDIGKMFDGIILDGVYEAVDNALEVIDSTGMNVIVQTGKCWFDHTYTINDANLTLTVSASDPTLNRIDAVVVEVDLSTAVRANSIKIIAGTPAGSPVPPTMETGPEKFQYPLAYITVDAGVTSIDPADISDKRGTVDCPWVEVPQSEFPNGPSVLEVQIFS